MCLGSNGAKVRWPPFLISVATATTSSTSNSKPKKKPASLVDTATPRNIITMAPGLTVNQRRSANFLVLASLPDRPQRPDGPIPPNGASASSRGVRMARAASLASAFQFLRNVPDVRPGAQGSAGRRARVLPRDASSSTEWWAHGYRQGFDLGLAGRRARGGAFPHADFARHGNDPRLLAVRASGLGKDQARGHLPHPLKRQPHRRQRGVDVAEGEDVIEPGQRDVGAHLQAAGPPPRPRAHGPTRAHREHPLPPPLPPAPTPAHRP